MNSIELVTNNKNGVNSTRTGYQWRFHDYCGFVSIILLLLSLNFVMWLLYLLKFYFGYKNIHL